MRRRPPARPRPRDRRRRDLARQQVVYTETFDVAPLCSPYVGAHMFGDDSPARSRLLTTLRELQQTRHATASASELPDHLSELFAFAPCLREDEWTELRALLLLPALQKMNAILAGSENPYRHLISAALRLTAATLSEEGAR
jgi:nitrate reductase assembly molybdenum cofactor insertion protein NarJ